MFIYHPKLVELVVIHTKKAIMSLMVTSIIFVYTYAEFIPYHLLFGWMLLQSFFAIFRLYNAKKLQKNLDSKAFEQVRKQTIYYFIGLIFSTIIWNAAAVLGYIFAPVAYQLIGLLLIVGVLTASLLSLSSLYAIYRVYFILMLLPQILIMFLSESDASRAMIPFMFAYIAVIASLSKVLQNNYVNIIRDQELLEENTKQLQEFATTDSLTGLYNRRHFFHVAQSLFSLALRDKKELSFLMIDIDFFKKINDTYGHQVGDKVLSAVAKEIKSLIRDSDLLARIGGEEFALVLYNTSLEGARIIANKIRLHIAQQAFELESLTLHITISIGVVSLNEEINSIEIMYQKADAQLYAAKADGRNRVF